MLHFSRKFIFGSTVAVFGLLLALRPLVGSAQDSPDKAVVPQFKPAAPRASLMDWHSRAFDELNAGIAKKDVKCAEAAWLLAELANVNQFHTEKDDYRKWADDLRDGAVEIANTIRKKHDFARAKTLSAKLKDTCKRCHDAYKI